MFHVYTEKFIDMFNDGPRTFGRSAKSKYSANFMQKDEDLYNIFKENRLLYCYQPLPPREDDQNQQ